MTHAGKGQPDNAGNAEQNMNTPAGAMTGMIARIVKTLSGIIGTASPANHASEALCRHTDGLIVLTPPPPPPPPPLKKWWGNRP